NLSITKADPQRLAAGLRQDGRPFQCLALAMAGQTPLPIRAVQLHVMRLAVNIKETEWPGVVAGHAPAVSHAPGVSRRRACEGASTELALALEGGRRCKGEHDSGYAAAFGKKLIVASLDQA